MTEDASSRTPLRGLSGWLAGAPQPVFSAYCIVAAFGTYFCMYAFRKPFTAATYEDSEWWGIGLKTILVGSQVAGYTLSKFIGIKVVSEMPPRYRAASILGLIAVAELALVAFGLTPPPWNAVWLFVNGLPLGMVFGLVLGFLEGRRVTEALSAGLCASFIVSSGFVKSVGRTLVVDYEVDPFWMPCLTGLLFVLPLLVCVGLLSQIPPPSAADERLRTRRAPMQHADRRAFFRRHWIGLIGLLVMYSMLTLIRSLRDDFGVEIWRDLGINEPDVFARSEFFVMLGVIVINGLAILIQNNRLAFLSSIGVIGMGFLVILGSIVGHRAGLFSPMAFMVLLGLGMYVPYVAFHTTVFERMIAAFREVGTIGYLMYLADAIGYLVYVAVMIYRNVSSGEMEFLRLMNGLSVAIGLIAILITIVLAVHFGRSIPRELEVEIEVEGEPEPSQLATADP